MGYDGGPALVAWASDDGGATWGPGTPLPEGPPFGPGASGVSVHALAEPGHALAVGGRGTVYATADGGETWAPVGRAPDMNDVQFVADAALDAAGRLYVGLAALGTERGWVYRTAVPVTVAVASEGPPPAPGEGVAVSVVPNPSRGAPSVTVTLAAPAEVQAVLYDGLGRRVAVLASGRYAAGPHALAVDGTDLPAGVYVVRVVTDEAATYRRFTLLR